MTREKKIAVLMLFVVVGMLLLAPQISSALSTPAPGDFMFDLYDIGVLKLLKGPLGYIVSAGFIIMGIWIGSKELVAGIPFIIGGAILPRADKIAESFGLLLR